MSKYHTQPKFDEIQKGHIASNFESVKSDEQVAFETSIQKGEVEVVSVDDLKESYGSKFFKSEDVNAFENQLESLIKKGQDSALEEAEWDFLEKGRTDMDALEAVAVATPKGYARVYVAKTAPSTEEIAE